MFSAIKQIFSPSDAQARAYEAYAAVVTQARKPLFFEQWQVPDTLDGRFDCIVLHLFLVLDRLDAEGKRIEAQLFSRYLSEAFFADMDRSLREMGASDTGVGPRVKKMAQAFYGRRKAYGEAMGDDAALEAALLRNVWREKEVAGDAPRLLAAYMVRNRQLLSQQAAEQILRGHIAFTA